MSRRCVSCPGEFEHEGPCHAPSAHTQLVAALTTMSLRASDAEREIDASAALLATARRRIAAQDAEIAQLRRELTAKATADRDVPALEAAALEAFVLRGGDVPAHLIEAAARCSTKRVLLIEPACFSAHPANAGLRCTLPPGHRGACWCIDGDRNRHSWSIPDQRATTQGPDQTP